MIKKNVCEKPKTSYERLTESDEISEEVKRKVESIRKRLDLVELRRMSEEKTRKSKGFLRIENYHLTHYKN